jgi:hypothetical protein
MSSFVGIFSASCFTNLSLRADQMESRPRGHGAKAHCQFSSFDSNAVKGLFERRLSRFDLKD